jgi:hypothetical protein
MLTMLSKSQNSVLVLIYSPGILLLSLPSGRRFLELKVTRNFLRSAFLS